MTDTTTATVGGPALPQKRRLVTAIPGPNSLALHDRRRASVSAALGASVPVYAARAGGGPSLIEAKVVRWQGHYEGDPQGYRDKAEIADGKARDPIQRLAAALVVAGELRDEEVAGIRQAAQDEIDRAVVFGESSPLPAPEDAVEDLFARPL